MFRLSTSSTFMQILLDSNAVFPQITLFGGTILEETDEECNCSATKLSLFRKRFLKTILLSLI